MRLVSIVRAFFALAVVLMLAGPAEARVGDRLKARRAAKCAAPQQVAGPQVAARPVVAAGAVGVCNGATCR